MNLSMVAIAINHILKFWISPRTTPKKQSGGIKTRKSLHLSYRNVPSGVPCGIHIPALPSHRANQGQAQARQPSCPSSAARLSCTCACQGTSPWRRTSRWPVRSPAGTIGWWTIRMNAGPGLSKRSPPIRNDTSDVNCKSASKYSVTRIRIPKFKFRLCRPSFGIRMPRLEEISCAGRLQNKSRQVRKSARAKSVWKKHDSRTHDEWPQGWHREIISRSTDGRLFFFGGQWHRTAHLRASL